MTSEISVLCIGDPHFKRNNTQDVDQFIINVVKVAKSKKPDIIVVLGDLLDKHDVYYVDPFNRAMKFLDELRKVALTFLIVGNHDYSDNSQFLTDRHAYVPCKGWDNFVVVDEIKKYEKNGHTFFFSPYVSPGRFEEALNTSNDVWEMSTCIFCHQEFKGCKMGGIVSEIGDEWSEDYPLVISGHIHNAQTVGDNIMYPGSSMQHSYGENDDKTIWFVNFSLNEDLEPEIEIEEIDLGLPKRKLLTLSPKKIEKFDPSEYKNAHLKIAVKTSRSKFHAFRKSQTYSELKKKGVILSFKPEDISTHLEMARKMKEEHKQYGTNFKTTLQQLIKEENNENLMNIFREIEESS